MASQAQSIMAAEKSALLTQGILAILFGVAAVFWPGLTTVTLVYLFAAFLLANGVISLIVGLVSLRSFVKALLVILLSLVELGLGLYLFRNPEVAFGTLILILGFALIIRGVFSLVHAFVDREAATTRTMHGIMGVLGVVIGIIILAQPVAGGLAFVWVLGLYALIVGPVLIAMSVDVGKSVKRK